MDITRHLIVTGRVQGVGFRHFVIHAAQDMGVTGWVRNRSDGSVEAVISGTADAVALMIERTRRGPRLAAVQNLQVSDAEGIFDRFELLPTL